MKKILLSFLFCAISCVVYGNVFFKHLGKSDGLSQISVVSICQDEVGRMWFGTLEGLSCYDGNEVTVYKPSQMLDIPFLGNEVHNLVSAKNDIFFTSDGTLIRYDLREERFYDLQLRSSCLYAKDGEVWTAVRDSIFRWDVNKEHFSFVYKISPSKTITSICQDEEKRFWIGTHSGLYVYEGTGQPVCVLSEVNVHSLYCDSKGRTWVAAFRKGMYRVDRTTGGQFYVEADFELSNNDVRCFVEDNEGGIWVGTFNGLSKLEDKKETVCYRKNATPGSLQHSSVFSLYKDRQGSVWVGTYYGGVHYFHPEVNLFRHYSEQAEPHYGVSFPYIGNMVEDKHGNVWICTEGGGLNCWNRQTDTFTYYLFEESCLFPNLKCIEYDERNDCLYIGTHKQGFLRFDIPTATVKHYDEYKRMGDSFNEVILLGDSLFLLSMRGVFLKKGKIGMLERPFASVEETRREGVAMFIDSEHSMWLSLRNEIVRISMQSPQKKDVYPLGQYGLGKFMVTKFVEGADGVVYLGTSGAGLYKYDKSENCFKRCAITGADYIYNMKFHPSGYLILLTDRGVLCYHPQTGDMRILDAEKQLHLSAVNDGCGLLICHDGTVLVGGAKGMTAFPFRALFDSLPEYTIYFSSLSVNGKVVSACQENTVLQEAFPFASKLNLSYDENNISISLASNSYIDNSDRKIYEYCLEGFDRKWNTTYSNMLVYTNLDPGEYLLKVRECQLGERDRVRVIELPIIVHSPWWATWWAYILYFVTVLWIVVFLVRNWMARVRLRTSLAKEKLEKEKNEELIQAKIQFFANISHEFRTPLTLIISQVESLLQTAGLSPYVRTRLQKIYKSTFQFRDLISELLDFRKMERGKLTLHVVEADIVSYLGRICDEFQTQAQCQHIELEYQSEVETLSCWFDKRQLRKVFTNLLSNALKYTPSGKKVSLVLVLVEGQIEIRVVDNGEGIPKEALPFIFDRFYQADNKGTVVGSGIGLSLAKGIVELHHGTISVKSALGYGSVFTVILPVENPFVHDDNVVWGESDKDVSNELLSSGQDIASLESEEENLPNECNAVKDCILLVEDNEELLQTLTDLLSPLYRVVIAMDGKTGLEKAMEELPDLIVSDVMMPVMSGTEMCMKIKNNFDLCHIPVILLTAMTSETNKIEGLQCGADDYIEKPFHNKLLVGRIANILKNRRMLKQKFGTMNAAVVEDEKENVSALALTPIDSDFLTHLDEIVKAHLSESEFDVNQLARELGVSRSSLYNKLKALSFVTPNEFILNTRLKVAAELLRQHPEMQITEIAYHVGFNSLRYFRHCFKASFNQTPQEYRQNK